VVSEDWNLHQYCCENLKSQTCWSCLWFCSVILSIGICGPSN
jgi:hypothetical protein